jgi:hypothetical protein
MATENENSNTTEATNETVVGGDNHGTIKQGDQISQQIDSGATRFPVRDPENLNARVDRILSLLNLLPLNPSQFGLLSGGSTLLGLLGFMMGLVSLLPDLTGFMTWMNMIEVPFAGPVMTIGFIMALAGGYIIETLVASKCPECENHLSLRVTESDEVLYAGDNIDRVERTLVCDACSYETTRYLRNEPNPTN